MIAIKSPQNFLIPPEYPKFSAASYITNFVNSFISEKTQSDEAEYKVQHHEYTSFGKLVAVTDTSGNDISSNPVIDPFFTYTGREFDKETGLYYYRARIYDPERGQFLTVDPDAGSLRSPGSFNSKYVYTENNPINAIDPYGLFKLSLNTKDLAKITVVGAALGNFYSQYKTEINSALIIAGAVAITVASGGAAAPVLYAALAGGAISAGFTALSGGSGSDIFRSAMVGAAGGAVGGATTVIGTGMLTSAGSGVVTTTLAGSAAGAAGGAAAVNTASLLKTGTFASPGQTGFGASLGLFGGGVYGATFRCNIRAEPIEEIFDIVDKRKHPSFIKFILSTYLFKREKKAAFPIYVLMMLIFIIVMSHHPDNLTRWFCIGLGILNIMMLPLIGTLEYYSKLFVKDDIYSFGLKDLRLGKGKISDITYLKKIPQMDGMYIIVIEGKSQMGRTPIFSDVVPEPFKSIKVVE